MSISPPAARNPRLNGKAGLVVGGTTGLGLATVTELAAEGAGVVAFARDRDRGERAIEEVAGAGGRASFFRGDALREEDIVDAITHCIDTYGSLDFIHNNVGIHGPWSVHNATNEEWELVLTVNLTATFWGCKHAIRAMLAAGNGGSIINTGSILSFTADPLGPGYAATKSALLGLTRSIALAYADRKIRCNCVCPGDFASPMLDTYFNATPDPTESRRRLTALQPSGRIPHPREIAPTVAFLVSDDSTLINGAAIVVDGGMLVKCY